MLLFHRTWHKQTMQVCSQLLMDFGGRQLIHWCSLQSCSLSLARCHSVPRDASLWLGRRRQSECNEWEADSFRGAQESPKAQVWVLNRALFENTKRTTIEHAQLHIRTSLAFLVLQVQLSGRLSVMLKFCDAAILDRSTDCDDDAVRDGLPWEQYCAECLGQPSN